MTKCDCFLIKNSHFHRVILKIRTYKPQINIFKIGNWRLIFKFLSTFRALKKFTGSYKKYSVQYLTLKWQIKPNFETTDVYILTEWIQDLKPSILQTLFLLHESTKK